MKYIALLRGINVGGNKRVEMKQLKALFEALGFTNVSTYINSGNIVFESNKDTKTIQKDIDTNLVKEFGFAIPTLIKTQREMQKIARAIPQGWQNDTKQRTDVDYLFDEINNPKIIDELPVNRKYVDVRYVKGAIFWNLDRANIGKSRLNKLIGHKVYRFMTMRNVNTALFLAGN